MLFLHLALDFGGSICNMAVKLTTKDYRAIADVIDNCYLGANDRGEPIGAVYNKYVAAYIVLSTLIPNAFKNLNEARITKFDIVTNLANALEEHNPWFSRGKFIVACFKSENAAFDKANPKPKAKKPRRSTQTVRVK